MSQQEQTGLTLTFSTARGFSFTPAYRQSLGAVRKARLRAPLGGAEQQQLRALLPLTQDFCILNPSL